VRITEITNYLLDRVCNTTLFEMAHERKLALDVVRGVANQIVFHLIYLYLYPESPAKNHWKTEINVFLNKIDNLWLKPTGRKKLSGKDYYDKLFSEPLEGDIIQLKSRVNKIIRKEGEPSKTINLFLLKESLEKIIHDISYDLSNDQFVTIEDYLTHFNN